MLKAAEGNGSSFRLGITNNDISINDYRSALFACQAELAQPDRKSRSRARTGQLIMRVAIRPSGLQTLARFRQTFVMSSKPGDTIQVRPIFWRISVRAGHYTGAMPRSFQFAVWSRQSRG